MQRAGTAVTQRFGEPHACTALPAPGATFRAPGTARGGPQRDGPALDGTRHAHDARHRGQPLQRPPAFDLREPSRPERGRDHARAELAAREQRRDDLVVANPARRAPHAAHATPDHASVAVT